MEVFVFALIPVLAVLAAATWIVWQVLRGLGWVLVRIFRGGRGLLGRVFRFARTEIVEAIQLGGGLLTAAVLLPLSAVNLAIGRYRTSRHYARALEDELVSALLGAYRLVIGHPLHLVGLGGLLTGLERRIPEVVDRAPRSLPRAKAGVFEGYVVRGTLPAGGSGAQLFLARPRPETLARAREAGRDMPDEVVIKSFALTQGSTLPQIVRESRALEAAKRLGLVLEHHLEEGRFFYVMRYVRGDDLDRVVADVHAKAGPDGLDRKGLARMLVYAQDLLHSLDRFHTGGLWHKDVKPANLIVSEGHAHLVDFGLVTPLQSALTLTTHGTEYYRDPEMVRLAMQGVKVHEVDGVKFDLYSAGAVLFSMMENSFPAHGSLSRLTRRCPEALAYVIRRSMADISSRYTSAWQMLEDVRTIAEASDPYAVVPADLPSVRFGDGVKRPPVAAAAAAAEPLRPIARQPEPRPRSTSRDLHPYLVSGPGNTGAGTRSRSRRRGVLAAAGLVFLSVAFVGRLAEESDRRHPPSSHAVAQAPRLHDSERETFELAKSVVEEFALDEEFASKAKLWQRHLEERLPRRADSEYRGNRGKEHAHHAVAEGARAGGIRAGGGAQLAAHTAERVADRRPVSSRTTPETASGATGRVLILEDAVDEVTLRALETALELRGYQISESMEAEVGARHAVGLGTLEDDLAHSRLQAFLDDQGDLDMILWLANSEEEGSRYHLLVRSDLAAHEAPVRLE